MATNRETLQGIVKTVAAALGTKDEHLDKGYVREILHDMEDLAAELKAVLE